MELIDSENDDNSIDKSDAEDFMALTQEINDRNESSEVESALSYDDVEVLEDEDKGND